jgi:NADPH-dependent curcumin reductase CurA
MKRVHGKVRMGSPTRKRVRLRQRPQGKPRPDDFILVEETLPSLAEGELLIRNDFLALDPAIRGWLSERNDSYQPPVPLGSVVRAMTAGCILASRHRGFQEGQFVTGLNGWEDYSISRGGLLSFVEPSPEIPLSLHLGVLGTTGLTAYFGLLDVGKPVPGETVLVSSAAGSVGSIVGQIARLMGCRAVGIAGGKAKCDRVRTEFRFDAAIDRLGERAIEDLVAESSPEGVHVYFDNVGGQILDAVLTCLAPRARVVLCGSISTYNDVEPHGLRNTWQLLVKNARMEGFLFSAYASRFAEAKARLSAWVKDGSIRHDEVICQGLDRAVPSFIELFEGRHAGKILIELTDG